MSYVNCYRTVWLSDIHLGSRACRVDILQDFLRRTRCQQLYLVGDIVDLQRMRSRFYWPKSHTDVLQNFLRMARDGTRVIYIPGNHDDDFRAMAGGYLGSIEVAQKLVHTTASGKRLLVLHGDEFDGALKCGPLSSLIGCVGYGTLLALNRINHRINKLMGRPYWSLAQSVKMRIEKAARYVARFEDACLHAASEAGLDGVICGHIHKAGIIERDGLIYCNDGDWVESCTALVESAAGELSIEYWGQMSSAKESALALPLSDAA